jgi:transcriptional regulator
MSKTAVRKANVTVAEFLTKQIDLAVKYGKTQTEIAKELGYEKPNIITMFKQGRTKLPLPKVVPLAKSLGIDPVHMLRIVMAEYSPDTWEVLEEIVGQKLVSTSEQETLKVIREVAGDLEVAPKTAEEVKELKELVTKWKKKAAPPVSVKHA